MNKENLNIKENKKILNKIKDLILKFKIKIFIQ